MTTNRPICSPNVLTFFLFMAVALAASANAVSGLSNETDYQALLAFKARITSDPSEALNQWNDSLHLCDWEGVTCGKRHRRVTKLNLSSLGLVGQLSPHIGNLSFLRELRLYQNGFRGVIPQEIGRLSRLQRLNLINNSFEGELPTNLTYCRDLSTIALGGNNLRGRIPHELGSLLKLTRLVLSYNQFTGEISSWLGNLSSLTELYLKSNHLEGSVPPELGKVSNLAILQIAFNNLSGPIPTSLYNISSIEEFDVTGNNLSGVLPSDLFLILPKLKRLYLGLNKFSGQLPASLSNASQLVTIYLAVNSFTGRIPTHLASLEHLQTLGFGGNLLGTEEGDDLRFITSLTNCTQLHVVALESNRLKGELPRSIGNFSATFKTLSLWGNLVSGVIPYDIGNLVNLEGLWLQENMLVGRIPKSIGKLSNLNVLTLEMNNISGMIPSSIGSMASLSVLALFQNKLEGSIPNSIGNCTNLNSLDLSKNRLIGPVSEELFRLASLSVGLDLSENYLTGPIPSQVGTLVNLGYLDLSRNNMSGEIPSSLGDCLVLQYLQLGGNQFSGAIPSTLSNLRGLELLDVSQNNLSGRIPGFMVNLPLIMTLNLSFNMFEGEVPNGGAFCNLSAVSVAGNDKLCGGPPILQLPKCKEGACEKERSKLRSRRTVLVISLTVAIFLLLLTGGIITMVLRRSKRSRRETTVSSLMEHPHARLSYVELLQATDGFSHSNMIGEGSFGTVYKGVLPSDGHIVAVKVLKLEEHGASKSFIAECEALRNIRHRNLVKTITCCSTIDFQGEDFKALVFEYMPNGSLDKWLHPVLDEMGGNENNTRLSAVQRLSITIDVATAVDYLHHHGQAPIVHSDLKPSNILLDSQFSAHVSDFGLAKFLLARASARDTSSIGIRGTIGYVPPEYGLGGVISMEGDVYSFGIFLLELFTGKRPTGPMFSGEFGLREYIERALPDGLNEVIDPVLRLGEAPGDLRRCLVMILRVGLMCSAAQPTERMEIGDAVAELHKARDVLQVRRRRNRL